MNRILALALASVFTFGTAGAVMAEDVAPKPVIDGAKKPGDGKKFDREKFHEEMFAKTDKNGDGVLSKEEFLESHRERAEKAFEAIDTNKDGKLSKEELKEGRKKWHDKMKRGGKGPRGEGHHGKGPRPDAPEMKD